MMGTKHSETFSEANTDSKPNTLFDEPKIPTEINEIQIPAPLLQFRDKKWDSDSDNGKLNPPNINNFLADPLVYDDINPYTLLSWEKVKYEISLTHPRKNHTEKGKKINRRFGCCEVNTGCLCPFGIAHRTDLA